MSKRYLRVVLMFALLLTYLFGLIIYTVDVRKVLVFPDYLIIGLIMATAILTSATSLAYGLIASAVGVFIYGSMILYQSLTAPELQLQPDYVFLLGFPISALCIGYITDLLHTMIRQRTEWESEKETLVSVDSLTGLENFLEFNKDLEEEMARSKRHGIQLVLTIIEVQYYDEMLVLLGSDQMKNRLEMIAQIILSATRVEDKRYRIGEKTFAVIMPHTDIEGALIVKERMRQDLKIAKSVQNNRVHTQRIDVRIGMLPYEPHISTSLEYKRLVEKEVEFDV